MPGPHAIRITLSQSDRATLEDWTRRRKTAQSLALRARIVLACAEPGATNGRVAATRAVSRPTVASWRRRFAERGPDGLLDEPRPGRPRRITAAQVERAVVTTREAEPPQAPPWSTRSLAAAVGLSQSAVGRIWRAFALPPHRTATVKLARDPLFVDKVRDIVGLYLARPDRALVLCVDEKPPIQASARTAPVVPLRPGQVARRTRDDGRHGTTDLFAALAVKTGKVIGAGRQRHRSREVRAFLDLIDRHVPPDLAVHRVLDNASTPKAPLIQRWLAERPRDHRHFTPTSGSWLNLVESWFALLTARRLRRGVFRSTRALEQAIRRSIASTNDDPKPFVWTKPADDMLASVERFCQRTSNSHH
jgi:transposase